jgi:hypothetical protein
MLEKEQLLAILNRPESELDFTELAGKRSAESRGLPYYGDLRKMFQFHFSSFSRMHERIKESGLETDFPRTALGFVEYLIYLGDVPYFDGDLPTAGRFDHGMGYVRGNFSWQSKKENSSESLTRNHREGNISHACGSRIATAVLTDEIVRAIRRIRDEKLQQGWKHSNITKFILERVSAGRNTINDVIHNRTWTHVK